MPHILVVAKGDDSIYNLLGFLVLLVIGAIAKAIKAKREASAGKSRQSDTAQRPPSEPARGGSAAPPPPAGGPARRRVILTAPSETIPSAPLPRQPFPQRPPRARPTPAAATDQARPQAMAPTRRRAVQPTPEQVQAEEMHYAAPEVAERTVDQVGKGLGTGVLKNVQRMDKEVQAELTGQHRGASRTAGLMPQQAVGAKQSVLEALNLGDRSQLVRAVIYYEILGLPKSLRQEKSSWET